MAFIPVANVAQVRCEGIVDGQQTINDLYFEISGGGITSVNLAGLVTAVNSWFSSPLASLLSDDWSTVRVVGVDLTSVTGPEFIQSSITPGGTAGEAAPNNVAACVSFRTASRGRSFRGRNFVPAIPNSLITLNTLDDTFLGNLLIAYNSLVGAGTFLAGWQFVVVSRFSGVDPVTHKPIPRSAGIASPVTAVVATSNKVRSMRSREVGHGS